MWTVTGCTSLASLLFFILKYSNILFPVSRSMAVNFLGNARPHIFKKNNHNISNNNKALPHIILVWFWWWELILFTALSTYSPLPSFMALWKSAFNNQHLLPFSFFSRKSSKAVHCHKILSHISLRVSALPCLQESRIRHTQQLRLSSRLIKGSIFSLAAFSVHICIWVECVLFQTSAILEVILVSLDPHSCASFSRNLLTWPNAVSTD